MQDSKSCRSRQDEMGLGEMSPMQNTAIALGVEKKTVATSRLHYWIRLTVKD